MRFIAGVCTTPLRHAPHGHNERHCADDEPRRVHIVYLCCVVQYIQRIKRYEAAMKVYVRDDGRRLEVSFVVQRPLAIIRIVQMVKRWRQQSERTPGLHAGAYQVRDDFDEPLPEDFLITGS